MLPKEAWDLILGRPPERPCNEICQQKRVSSQTFPFGEQSLSLCKIVPPLHCLIGSDRFFLQRNHRVVGSAMAYLHTPGTDACQSAVAASTPALKAVSSQS